MSELIIDSVYGWREDDYDGYNDYYVNPEYHRSETTRKRCQQQDEFDNAINGGMFGDTERVDCKKFLENYFNVKF